MQGDPSHSNPAYSDRAYRDHLTMWNCSVPVFRRGLLNLKTILNVGEEFFNERELQDKAVTTYKLAPDMLPLRCQVFMACDKVLEFFYYLTELGDPPVFKNENEFLFSDLHDRIDYTLNFIKRLTPDMINGLETKKFQIPMNPKPDIAIHPMNGYCFLMQWAIPHFFFHVTTTYATLRHLGAPLKKLHYIDIKIDEKYSSIPEPTHEHA
jgi:uncharacterized protein